MTEERERQLAERRKEKSKEKRGKYLPKIILTLIIIVVFITLCLTVFFRVGKITVEGDSIYNAEEIIKASGVKKGDSVILLNTEKVEEKIEDTYKDIGEIEVKKKLLTGKVIITDKGYSSLYAIPKDENKKNSGYFIIDTSNKVRRIVEKKPKKVAKVIGLKLKTSTLHSKATFKDTNTYNAFVDLIEALKRNEFSNITKIEISKIDSIAVTYDGRIEMKIGTLSNLDEKLKKAKHIVTKEEGEKVKGTLDLTVDNTAYFKPKKKKSK